MGFIVHFFLLKLVEIYGKAHASALSYCEFSVFLVELLNNFFFQVHTSLLRWLIPSTDVAISSRDLSELPLDVYAHVTLLCCLKNNVRKTPTRIPLLNIEDDLHCDNSLSVSTVHSLHSYDSDVLLRFPNSQKTDVVGELKK